MLARLTRRRQSSSSAVTFDQSVDGFDVGRFDTLDDSGEALTMDANDFGPIKGVTTTLPDGTEVTRRGNNYIDSLAWMVDGDPFRNAGEKGKTIINFAFGNKGSYALLPGGGTLPGINALNWNANHGPQGPVRLLNGDIISFGNVKGEQAAVLLAHKLWENVANIQFKDIGTANVLAADLKYLVTNNANMKAYWRGQEDWEYHFSETPTATGPKSQMGFTVFNQEYDNYKTNGLRPGSLGFYDTVHEIGHQLGLDHPWKEEKGAPFFAGATSADDTGQFGLNQGIYSIMSYSYGWDKSYRPQDGGMPPENYGSAIGPMAFDIAAIQAIYGANMRYHRGNDVYRLPTKNKFDVGWMCLWDAGGTDAISAEDAIQDCVIDLRTATLNSSDGAGAGGYVSWVKGVMGGFTIAHGVVIENATGGNGNDKIIGNAANNVLLGGKGNDSLFGLAGHDTIDGGEGADWISGGSQSDVLIGGKGNDTFLYLSRSDFGTLTDYDVIQDFKHGDDVIAFAPFGTGSQTLVFSAREDFSGRSGELIFVAKETYGFLMGDWDGDKRADFKIKLNGVTRFDATDLRL